MTTSRWLVCDLDHTLFDSRGRDAMLVPPVDWDAYQLASPDDPPVPEMIAMVNSLHRTGWSTLCLTGRNEKFRPLTARQLLDHGVDYDELLMRPLEDFRPAPALKLGLLMRRLGSLADVGLVVEDRDDCVAAFKGHGLTVLQAHVRPINRSER